MAPAKLTLMSTGDSVSVMIAFWIVAVPVLAMFTWYVTVSPMPGEAGAWVWATVKATAGAGMLKPVTFEG